MFSCQHHSVTCLNPFELIRKYRCEDCSEVMMCACEKEHGERFLPHQLTQGCVLESQERVTVTIGFHDLICPECRGERPIHAPKASRPGYTSKVTRYYWREISFETSKRFYNLNPELDPNNDKQSEFLFPEKRKIIEKEVIEEIKKKHKESPKYEYSEQSQSAVIKETDTEVILVKGHYLARDGRKVSIQGESGALSAEEFAAEYFEGLGYRTLTTESVPFHVLFGTYMWGLIQDSNDTSTRLVSFGSRTEFDSSEQKPSSIHINLPSDFGTEEYYSRREVDVINHVNNLKKMGKLFDRWETESINLREYLWAHREKDRKLARTIVDVLPDDDLKKILLYLTRNYWKNFCGWPDLLVYKDNEFIFVEVKSSNDKLSDDQKNWLKGNELYMAFKVKIFKIGK